MREVDKTDSQLNKAVERQWIAAVNLTAPFSQLSAIDRYKVMHYGITVAMVTFYAAQDERDEELIAECFMEMMIHLTNEVTKGKNLKDG